MAPYHLEVGGGGVVGIAFLPVYTLQIVDTEISVEFITLAIGGLSRQSPGAFRIDFTCKGEVNNVVDGEIVASIAQIEPTVVVVAECRHDHSRSIFVGEREIAERHGQRQRQTRKHHIGRSRDDIPFRLHLRAGELQIEVGIVMVVACGITGVLDVVVVLVGLLGLSAGEIPLPLLCHHIGYVTALALEIIAHGT